MTDNQIIKALECCADEMGCKKGCPCFDPKAKGSCCTISKIGIEKIALDLINRQQAEIERLQKVKEQIKKEKNKILDAQMFLAKICDNLEKKLKTAKAEAIKEFAERLKALDRLDVDVSYGYGREHYTEAIAVNLIDNLVKEIIGEE